MARSTALRRSRLRRSRLHVRSTSARVRVILIGLLLGVGGFVLLAGGGSLGAVFGVYSHYTKDLIAPEQVLAGQARNGSRIYDRHGRLLYEFADEEGGIRRPVLLEDVSPSVVLATICTEDPTFYTNPGISVRGLLRAGYENLRPDDSEQRFQGSGGSSITQQLAKITFIPNAERSQRSVDRKLKEAVLAVEFTRRYSKDQILEWYLNNIFYGNNAYGIGAAAHRYFGKPASDLSLAEASLLAGLPQSPGRYDPYGNLEESKSRQTDVLSVMADHGCITQEQADEAIATELQFAPRSFPVEAPHFVFGYMQPQLEAWFGKDTLYRAGLQIVTSLDLDLQKEVEGILEEEISKVERACGCHNGAVSVIRPQTGEVLAYVGSRSYWNEVIEGKVDNLQAVKQPGSSFKPIVYLSYFINQKAGPGSLIWDTPYRKPGNPLTGEEAVEIVDPRPVPPGPVSIRISLGSSLNIPAVRAAEAIGVEPIIRTANRLGYTTMGQEDIKSRRYGPAIATGGANLTLFEHTFAFATIANNGEMRGQRAVRSYGEGMRKIDPSTILKVNTDRGNTIYELTDPMREQAVPANYAYLVTNIMSDCSARYLIWGCSTFDIGRPYATKTGTQQGLAKDRQGRDTTLYNWQLGFTPDIAVGVWIGNQDNRPVNGTNFETANAAAAVWQRTMRAALRDVPSRPFPEPPGIQRASTINGRPGSFSCSATHEELWAVGDVRSPQEQCRIVNSTRPSNAPQASPTPNTGNRRDQIENPTTTGQAATVNTQPAGPGTVSTVLQSPPTGPTGPTTGPSALVPVAPAAPAQGPPAAATPITLVATGQQPAPGAPPPR